jgi:hypothetical protein
MCQSEQKQVLYPPPLIEVENESAIDEYNDILPTKTKARNIKTPAKFDAEGEDGWIYNYSIVPSVIFS